MRSIISIFILTILAASVLPVHRNRVTATGEQEQQELGLEESVKKMADNSEMQFWPVAGNHSTESNTNNALASLFANAFFTIEVPIPNSPYTDTVIPPPWLAV
jgi:hypothetical protein